MDIYEHFTSRYPIIYGTLIAAYFIYIYMVQCPAHRVNNFPHEDLRCWAQNI